MNLVACLKERKKNMSCFKKIIAIVLSFTMIFCMASAGASASDGVNTEKSETSVIDTVSDIFSDVNIFEGVTMEKGFLAALIKVSMNALNVFAQGLLKGLCAVYPNPKIWKSYEDFTGENILDGRADYQTAAADGAQYKLGYSSASLIPEDFEEGKYYMGRQLNVVSFVEGAKAKGIIDDQRVRVVCVDDGSGKGAVVIAVIDGIGVTSTTIRNIRAKLADYVESGKISSINVSATHCHSAIDTQGVSTSFLYTLFANAVNNIFGFTEKVETSYDSFIGNLIDVSAAAIEDAYNSMESGKLYYDKADGSDYIYDKRGLIKDIPPIGILHFVPDSGNDDTYLVNLTCHPTSVRAKNALVSSDYIYYMDEKFIENDCNFLMTQGAVGQLTREDSLLEMDETLGDLADTTALGYKFAEIVLDASEDGEEELAPVINVKHTGTNFRTTNYLLQLACECRLVDNEVYRTGLGIDDVVLPSEVGYLEFGRRAAFGLYPCEFYPEVFHGGAVSAEDSWDGKSWDYAPMPDMVDEGIDLYCVCFANDYIGYVVPDNYYAFLGHIIDLGEDNEFWGKSGVADECLSAGKNTASQIVECFEGLVESLDK